MESLGVTLKFPSKEECADFARKIENLDLRSEPFSLANREESLHSDNELLTLMIMFMQNGGLPAVTAFIGLLRDLIKELMPSKSVTITHNGKTFVVTGNLSSAEVEKIVDALTSRK